VIPNKNALAHQQDVATSLVRPVNLSLALSLSLSLSLFAARRGAFAGNVVDVSLPKDYS